MRRKIAITFILTFFLLVSVNAVFAQTTSFVFQGKLTDNGLAANGTYQFQFTMFDASSGGSQIGQTLSDIQVTVTNGIFAVNLDFGINSFDGTARYIQVGVRLNGTGQNYTILNPRQAITSTPYAVKSLKSDEALTANNSLNLGGIAANQYVVTTDSRMSDARNPLPNSPNYIQNGTALQTTSNFNISGEGKANSFNATTNYRIGGNRVFHLTGTDNTSIGFESGNSITTGGFNAFFGTFAGKGTTNGLNNSFFGSYAGRDNATGSNNAFFGANAGISNNASFNAFFGSNSGLSNTNAANNSYFGFSTGSNNSTGDNNSFFGSNAGKSVADSSFNSFFGSFSGEKTTTGAGNTFIGTFAGRENTIGFNNTFIGYKAGQTPTTGNGNVVIGYNASVTSGVSNSIAVGANVIISTSNTIRIGSGISQTFISGKSFLNDVSASALSSSSVSTSDLSSTNGNVENLTAKSLIVDDLIANSTLVANFKGEIIAEGMSFGQANIGGSSTAICSRPDNNNPGFNEIVLCSSSLRYKNNVQNFTRGLELINQLRPVTFNWKNDNTADVGFIAEEVNGVEPLLSVFNSEGEVEGVKYAQITTALVNAIKEQQTQIETQKAQNRELQKQINAQQAQIDALKAIVCAGNPAAAICQPNK